MCKKRKGILRGNKEGLLFVPLSFLLLNSVQAKALHCEFHGAEGPRPSIYEITVDGQKASVTLTPGMQTLKRQGKPEAIQLKVMFHEYSETMFEVGGIPTKTGVAKSLLLLDYDFDGFEGVPEVAVVNWARGTLQTFPAWVDNAEVNSAWQCVRRD